MSRHERWRVRDRTYSNFHRYGCSRFATMIDVDGLDYCERCRMPLLLVESARDCGQLNKPTIVLAKLAQAANVPAICVLWTPSDEWSPDPPHCQCQRMSRRVEGCDHGVKSFRWRMVYPEQSAWKVMPAADMARWIDHVHLRHGEAVHDLNAA